MPEYELTEVKKAILLNGLELMIAHTKTNADDFTKGVVLSEMFETKEILKNNKLIYRD